MEFEKAARIEAVAILIWNSLDPDTRWTRTTPEQRQDTRNYALEMITECQEQLADGV